MTAPWRAPSPPCARRATTRRARRSAASGEGRRGGGRNLGQEHAGAARAAGAPWHVARRRCCPQRLTPAPAHPRPRSFFNNTAVAARAALARGLERVLIFDWCVGRRGPRGGPREVLIANRAAGGAPCHPAADRPPPPPPPPRRDVHHGNGTQQIFWGDARVLTMSIHRRDGSFYPAGLGFATEARARARARHAAESMPLPAKVLPAPPPARATARAPPHSIDPPPRSARAPARGSTSTWAGPRGAPAIRTTW